MAEVNYSKTVKLCGINKEEVLEKIANLTKEDGNLTITIEDPVGEVYVKVEASAEEAADAKKLAKPVVKALKERLGEYIYTTEDEVTLEKAVVDLLIANDLTVGTIESCTGGMLASRLIDVPGVSDCFKSGLITYSNKAKRKFAGVKKSTLDKHGAVSPQTATEMAKGLAILNKADVTIATTGIAGPGGGSEEKPVGLVYIACNVCGKVTVKECHFEGDRRFVRESTVVAALDLMRRCMLEYFSEKTFG